MIGGREARVELVEHGLTGKGTEGIVDVLGDRNVPCRHFTVKFVDDHFWAAGGANVHVITRELQSIYDACLGVKNVFGESLVKLRPSLTGSTVGLSPLLVCWSCSVCETLLIAGSLPARKRVLFIILPKLTMNGNIKF